MTIQEQVLQLKQDFDEVKSAGRQAEWTDFWDAFQWKGTRTSYPNYAFGSGSFCFNNFFPKYPIAPTGNCQYLFYNQMAAENSKQGLNSTGSLTERLEHCGVYLDVSQCERLSGLFGYTYFTETPPINVTGLKYEATDMFKGSSKLETIGKITTKESITYKNWFTDCNALRNIAFEGDIGENIDLHWSTELTYDSLMNIINHLKDMGSTRTLTIGEPNLIKLTDAEKAIATEKRWTLA